MKLRDLLATAVTALFDAQLWVSRRRLISYAMKMLYMSREQATRFVTTELELVRALGHEAYLRRSVEQLNRIKYGPQGDIANSRGTN